MSRERDLEVLRAAREQVAAEQARDDGATRFVEKVGVAAADQHFAACGEVKSKLRPHGGYQYAASVKVPDDKVELIAMCVAGFQRCVEAGRACEHAIVGDRPILVLLAPRIAACEACVAQWQWAVTEQDARVLASADNLCDFCLEESDFFRPTQMPFGPCVITGDLCDACAQRFLPPAAVRRSG